MTEQETNLDTEDEVLRVIRDTDNAPEDEFHEHFEKACPGDYWTDVGDEADRLGELLDDSELCDPTIAGCLYRAIAAEAFNRGVAYAARYLGVPAADLKDGVEYLSNGDCEPLAGISIPHIEA